MTRKKSTQNVVPPVEGVTAEVKSSASLPPRLPRSVGTYGAVIALLFFCICSITLYFLPPHVFISLIPFKNAPLFLGALAFLGSLMVFGGLPIHLMMITFILSGYNPYLCALCVAGGEILGIICTYYVGFSGRALLPASVKNFLLPLERLTVERWWLPPVVLFFYSVLLPYSKNILTIPLGLVRYSFWKTMLPLMLGTLIFTTVLALVTVYSYESLVPLLPYLV